MCFITVPLRNRHTTMDGPHGQRPTPNRLTAQYRLQLAAGTRQQDDHRRPACGNQNIRIARRRSRTLPRRPLRATSRCSSRSHVPLTTARPSPCSQCAMDVGGGQPGEDTVRRARGHRGCRPRPARCVSHYGSLLHIPFGRVATTAAVASCAQPLALVRRCGGAALCTVGAGLA